MRKWPKVHCTLIILNLEQPPWSEWSKSDDLLRSKTSLTKSDIEHFEILCHLDLLEIEKAKKPKKSTRKSSNPPRERMSTFNMLLLTLTWLWSYPKGGYRTLATTFYSPSTSIIRIISATLHILDMRTEYLRKWPSNYHYRIEGGKFANAIGAVDSFPILISFRPKGNANRKRLFYYRERKWAYKVQTFVGYFESSSLFCCGSNTI